jgi:hypothetical protein
MSYFTMDHAAWAEQNNAAGRRIHKKPKYSRQGGHKIGYHGAPEKLNDFQARVIDIVGTALGGIYNAPIYWPTIEWDNGYGWNGMSITMSPDRDLATWDRGQLTLLVFLCHEARIRMEIRPAGMSLRLRFWPRADNGPIAKRHPNIEEAVASFREQLPADHRIVYRESDSAAPSEAA